MVDRPPEIGTLLITQFVKVRRRVSGRT